MSRLRWPISMNDQQIGSYQAEPCIKTSVDSARAGRGFSEKVLLDKSPQRQYLTISAVHNINNVCRQITNLLYILT